MKTEIIFTEGSSFIGHHAAMYVNGDEHRLICDKHQTYEQHAVKILKEIYNIDFDPTNIIFKWDGQM